MARSAMVETPHTAGDHPPHLELIPLHDEARQVLRIGGFENVLVSSLGQPLHADFSVEGRNDDMPGQGVQLPIYHHDVAIEDPYPDHAVTGGLDQIGVWRVHTHQLVERQWLVHMILRWAWEPGRHPTSVERQFDGRMADRAYDYCIATH